MNIHIEELQQESGKNSYLLFVEQIRDSLSHQTLLTSNSDNKDRTQDKMAGIGEIFGSFSGWLKLLELIFSFITLIIHR